MCRIILSSVACPAVTHFSTLFHKQRNFPKKKKSLSIKRVLIFSTNLSEAFLILRRIQHDIVINVTASSCKVPLLLSDFNETSVLSTDFRKNTQIPNFVKIRPIRAELFHAYLRTDGQTNEANSCFSKFCERA
jgi:hypothetical protein